MQNGHKFRSELVSVKSIVYLDIPLIKYICTSMVRPQHVEFENVIWHPQIKIDRRPSRASKLVPALSELSYEEALLHYHTVGYTW